MSHVLRMAALPALLVTSACATSAPSPTRSPVAPLPVPAPLGAASAVRTPWSATQLMVVTTSGWDSTGGVLRRYERSATGESWREVGNPVAVMVGRSGLGWGMRDAAVATDAPIKREGDGRAPAGFFPVDTAFGFAPADSARWVRLTYAPLLAGSECVDDGASVHYNTIVDRNAVPRVDWTSAEHMRAIDQYRLGAIVGYNVPPVPGRGSCIFLHIWAGPGMPTTGCTSMAERDLTALLLWLDPSRMPVIVQLPEREYAARRAAWRLP